MFIINICLICVSIFAFMIIKRDNLMQTHLLFLTQRESRQEKRGSVCCEMPELCIHHNIKMETFE